MKTFLAHITLTDIILAAIIGIFAGLSFRVANVFVLSEIDSFTLISLVFSSGASLAAVVTASATSRTANEMKKQREMMSRPEIMPFSSINFKTGYMKNSAEKRSMENIIINIEWLELPSYSEGDPYKMRQDKKIGMPIVNIGSGAAKNVEIRWEFEIEKAIEEANRLAIEVYNTDYIYFELDDNWLKMNTNIENMPIPITIHKKNGIEKIDYILPVSIDPNPIKIKIPSAYCKLVYAILFFSFKKDPEAVPELPKITLSIRHTDIGGGKHEAKYVFSTDIPGFPKLKGCDEDWFVAEWFDVYGALALQSTNEHDLYRSETAL